MRKLEAPQEEGGLEPSTSKNGPFKMLIEPEANHDSNLFSKRRERRLSSLYYDSGNFMDGHAGMYGHKQSFDEHFPLGMEDKFDVPNPVPQEDRPPRKSSFLESFMNQTKFTPRPRVSPLTAETQHPDPPTQIQLRLLRRPGRRRRHHPRFV